MTPNPDSPEEILRRLLGPLPGGRILDVATGVGEFVDLLLTFLPGYDEVIGIDTHETSLAAARTRVKHERVSFVQMDAAALGFPDSGFDIVAISNSLHHLARRGRVLAEMRRVLKPGGRFIIHEMYRDGQTEPQMSHVRFHHWRAAIDRLRGDCHDPTLTRAEILAIVPELRLDALEITDLSSPGEVARDDETINWLEGQIDKSLEVLPAQPADSPLRQEAAELKHRIRLIGFTPADRLFIIGRKPA